MNDADWIVLDTETNGLIPPIAVVELGAQRMRGWEPVGPPFRFLLNQNAEISPEASRVNGYTREILERDGELPLTVYRAFADYTGDRPLVSFNLPFDLDKVLIPEWTRFGLSPAGQRGFCALRLAQRLLDPVPAGNCKLQTLRQYYRLPERGAHTAMGDVETTIDLLRNVLRPIAETRGLTTWSQLLQFSEEEWFPSQLTFGKHKGRDYREALADEEFHKWLNWLTTSRTERSARMGRWYLDRLLVAGTSVEPPPSAAVFPDLSGPANGQRPGGAAGLILFVDQEQEKLRALIQFSRARLAELEAEYTTEKRNVDALNAALFRRVRGHYQRRDHLQLVVNYRRLFLDTLIDRGEEEAEEVENGYAEEKARTDREYEEAIRETDDKVELTEAQREEIQVLWKKLVRLFHPDHLHGDDAKQAIYQRLTAAINEARDAGAIDTLKEIADDPDAYIARHGWGKINISQEDKRQDLRKLYVALEIQIVQRIEALERLRESAEYELMKQCRNRPGLLDEVAESQRKALAAEIELLETEAAVLSEEILELNGKDSGI
ncbi:MAG: exonuclease domain-containing protein [Phenylobacterium sp.]|uniref:exonuclease domain-containing protein n=1 Tax=Phenylobacterium sp. TaxID=1871053 RepID=UPI002725DF13|nr:exonuclease domain-containing protein [Phenylobacterium sp.]MDO8910689.1 exonuclease domain-containing protein [Phenylobacterium sp.]MDP3099043.1 exonuclease domain-containing protein [Phenylobacterium sp.]